MKSHASPPPRPPRTGLAATALAALTLLLAPIPALGSSAAAATRPRAKRPNVILIVIDTLRADHLSTYGYERETSPHLDALAAQGTLYENAVSAAPWTLPAHASLFTGLFPRDHHTTGNHWTLEPGFETLAERLDEIGYHTGGFSNNVWTNDVSGLKQGFDTFLEMWRTQKVRADGISADDLSVDMGAAKTTDEILGWVDGIGDGKPFFVFVNYFEPHMPYRPTKPFDDDFLAAGTDDATIQRLRSFYKPRDYGYILRAPWMEVSRRDLDVLTGLYDGEIAYVDSQIDRLVAGLRSRGVLDDTVLVITADHGEHLGENHMLEHKFSVYEPLLRVPLILWGPGRVPAGRRIAGQVQSHQLFGTVLEMAGADRGDAPPLPEDDSAPAAAYTFSQLAYPKIFLEVAKNELPGWKTERVERALTAVRGPRFKLISGSDGTVELYDLSVDPLEAKDLAASRPEVVERLQDVLARFRAGETPP